MPVAPTAGVSVRAAVAVAAVALALVRQELLPEGALGLALGALLLGFQALAFARAGARIAERLEPADSGASALLRSGLYAYGLLVTCMALAGALGCIRLFPLCAAAALLFYVCGPAERADRPLDPAALLAAARAHALAALFLVLFALLAAVDFGWAAQAPITATDDIAYHLASPVRWVQSGALGYEFLPFGNHSPSYYPMATELLFAWVYLPLREQGAPKHAQAPQVPQTLRSTNGHGRARTDERGVWLEVSAPV